MESLKNDATSGTTKPETYAWWQPALAVFGEVTGWIVVPIIAALYGGRYLDDRYGTGNWYFLGLTGVAFIISSVGISIVGVRYIRTIEQSTKTHERDTKRTNNT